MTEANIQNKLLDDIRNGDSTAIKLLYKNHFHYCTSFILKNQGTVEDAKELFQESLLVLLKNAADPDFKIEYAIRTYLYTICKNQWLKQLRQKKKAGFIQSIGHENKETVLKAENTLEEKKALEIHHLRLEECMNQLKEDARQLLQLTFYQKLSDKDIAPMMGYSSQFVRQKRKRVVEQLRKCMGQG